MTHRNGLSDRDSGGQPEPGRLRNARVLSMRLIMTVVVVVLLAVTVLGVGWVAERNARRALSAEIESRLLVEARNLALLSSDALLSDYPELTLFPVISEMQNRRSDLALVVVIDHEGTIKGHADARRLGTRFDLLNGFSQVATRSKLFERECILGNEETIAAVVPVAHAEQQGLGQAIVGLRREYLDTLINRTRQEIAVFTAGLLALATLSALVLMTLLLKPIGSLRAGLERIGRGDLDTPMHLKDRTELGLLADTVNDMAAELKASMLEVKSQEKEIEDTQAEIIHTLGGVVESRSRETANHIIRVGEHSYLLARLAGLPEEEARMIQLASPMHDVGKIGIPDRILNKPDKLTSAEYEVMKRHAVIGYEILNKSERRLLKAAAIIAHQHHEWWDGSGYPQGLKGEQIHIYGRIVGLVDVFDALSSIRIYREPMEVAMILGLFRQKRGHQFDPRLLDLFMQHIDEFLGILEKHSRLGAEDLPKDGWLEEIQAETLRQVDDDMREQSGVDSPESPKVLA